MANFVVSSNRRFLFSGGGAVFMLNRLQNVFSIKILKVNPRCCRCRSEFETIEHVLFRCSDAQKIWNSLNDFIVVKTKDVVSIAAGPRLLFSLSTQKMMLLLSFKKFLL
jgi:hypothetical protein